MILSLPVRGQLLFYQDTYRGGVTSDGVAYYGFDYLQPDTINFQTYIAPSSTIRRAYLFSLRFNFVVGKTTIYDNPLIVQFNNFALSFDSSLILTQKFTSLSGLDEVWVVGKDVTSYTQSSGNKLIIPCQSCLMGMDTSRNYVYDGFVLIIMYENSTLSTVNVAILLNNENMGGVGLYEINNLNPIINIADVGLSLWTNNVTSFPYNSTLPFTLSTSLGNFALGTLDQHYVGGWKKTLPGSFNYENNVLQGLVDDSPDTIIDSTDALANITSYIANSTSSFTLSTNPVPYSSPQGSCGFFLAYSTSCPERKMDTTTTYNICNGNSQVVSVNPMSGASYSWYASDGTLITATTTSVSVSPTVSTNYIAYVDSAGCKHTEHFRVLVNPVPKSDSVQVIDAICGDVRGSATILTPTAGGGPFSYSIGSGNQASSTFTNLNPGVYSYTVTNNVGCSYVKSNAFTINENNPSVASFSVSPASVCLNEVTNFYNTSTGTNGQWWSFSLTDTSVLQNPSFVFTDTGYYNVILIAWHNQRLCSDTIIQAVYVRECPPDTLRITIPNIFTPNGDEVNDLWKLQVDNLGYSITNVQIAVYDRWGLLVFETDKTDTGWDGRTTSGIACSAGTYYYIVKYEARSVTDGKQKSDALRGFLELMR